MSARRREIWKYTVAVGYPVYLTLPQNARVVHCAGQHGETCIWVEVNPDAFMESRQFQAFGTGWDIPPGWYYQGSAHLPNQGLVWHVYEYNEDHEEHAEPPHAPE